MNSNRNKTQQCNGINKLNFCIIQQWNGFLQNIVCSKNMRQYDKPNFLKI